MPDILIACEFSGIVRDAFIERGHDAISCDLLPTESEGPHIQGDVREVLRRRWKMVIGFPPCTYLCNSGVRWLYEKEGRWAEMRKSSYFFMNLLDANAHYVAVENPIMHRHTNIRKYNFSVQPYEFGHGETKRTCFWTKNLPPLVPTNIVEGRKPRVHYEAPSKDRWKKRSITYPGIAQAMAEQWGSLVG